MSLQTKLQSGYFKFERRFDVGENYFFMDVSGSLCVVTDSACYLPEQRFLLNLWISHGEKSSDLCGTGIYYFNISFNRDKRKSDIVRLNVI